MKKKTKTKTKNVAVYTRDFDRRVSYRLMISGLGICRICTILEFDLLPSEPVNRIATLPTEKIPKYYGAYFRVFGDTSSYESVFTHRILYALRITF